VAERRLLLFFWRQFCDDSSRIQQQSNRYTTIALIAADAGQS
jgi:hypothetical protein